MDAVDDAFASGLGQPITPSRAFGLWFHDLPAAVKSEINHQGTKAPRHQEQEECAIARSAMDLPGVLVVQIFPIQKSV
jgi:hypothetical protein